MYVYGLIKVGKFKGLYVTFKIFSCTKVIIFISLINIKGAKRALCFDLTVWNFIYVRGCQFVCLSIPRLRPHGIIDFHETWNQGTWSKGGAIY